MREWGKEGAPTAAFWHGLGPLVSGAYGRELAPALLGRGWRVLAPDAPGCGRSPARDPAAYGLDDIADLLLASAEGPVALIGHSWGGSLAVAAAARRPELVTALVLLDAGHRDARDRPGFVDASLEERIEQARADALRLADWDALLNLLREETRREPTDMLVGIVREAFEQKDDGIWPITTPEVLAGGMLGVDRGPRMSSLWPRLAETGLPVLLLTATEPADERAGNAANARRLLAAIPTAEWRELEGSGHRVLADAGPQVARIVASWLDAQTTRG